MVHFMAVFLAKKPTVETDSWAFANELLSIWGYCHGTFRNPRGMGKRAILKILPIIAYFPPKLNIGYFVILIERINGHGNFNRWPK